MAKLKRNKLTPQQQQWVDEQNAVRDRQAKEMLAEVSAVNAGTDHRVTLEILEREWTRIINMFMVTQIKASGDRLAMSRDSEFVTNVKDFSSTFWKADFADRIKFITRYRISIRNATTCAGMLGFSP